MVKLDPAVCSAPFVATLVDVTGMVIYFNVASGCCRIRCLNNSRVRLDAAAESL